MRQWAQDFVAFDTEATGLLDNPKARVIEFGAVWYKNGAISDKYNSYINPGDIDLEDASVRQAFEVNHISPELVMEAPSFVEVFPNIKKYLGLAPVRVGHNVAFDVKMLSREFELAVAGGLPAGNAPKKIPTLNTQALDLYLVEGFFKRNLDVVADRWEVPPPTFHRAQADADVTAQILLKMQDKLPEDIMDVWKISVEYSKKWDAICQRMRQRRRQRSNPASPLRQP